MFDLFSLFHLRTMPRVLLSGMTKTHCSKTIAGRIITLEANKRYVASRPFARRRGETFPVTISEITPSGRFFPIYKVGTLSYTEANRFLGAFNNGAFGFEGRVW